jgi:hypothetical protein
MERRREQQGKGFWFLRQLVNDPIHVISAINDGGHIKRRLWKNLKPEFFPNLLKTINQKNI